MSQYNRVTDILYDVEKHNVSPDTRKINNVIKKAFSKVRVNAKLLLPTSVPQRPRGPHDAERYLGRNIVEGNQTAARRVRVLDTTPELIHDIPNGNSIVRTLQHFKHVSQLNDVVETVDKQNIQFICSVFSSIGSKSGTITISTQKYSFASRR